MLDPGHHNCLPGRGSPGSSRDNLRQQASLQNNPLLPSVSQQGPTAGLRSSHAVAVQTVGRKREVPRPVLQDGKVSRRGVLLEPQPTAACHARLSAVRYTSFVFHHVDLRACADVFCRVRVLRLFNVLAARDRVSRYFGEVVPLGYETRRLV